MDVPEVSQHVHEQMILLRLVMILTPHGRIKETMSTLLSDRRVLPTRLVLSDDLAEHSKIYILLQLHTPLSRTHI